jgi:hypothetical protein
MNDGEREHIARVHGNHIIDLIVQPHRPERPKYDSPGRSPGRKDKAAS